MSNRLRVLSYNIHKGFSSGKKKFVLQKMKDALREAKPDLVFLQEVIGENKTHQENIVDWPTESQFEFLADQTWHHFAYGKNAVYDAGHHGNALLSKFPIIDYANIDISPNWVERRGILYGKIELAKTNVHCFCLHLGLLHKDRQAQVARLIDHVTRYAGQEEHVIIAGDFNDWKKNATAALEKNLQVQEVFVKHQGHHVRTYPSRLPLLTLDRIYIRGFEISEAQVLHRPPWTELSDHAALLADLRLV